LMAKADALHPLFMSVNEQMVKAAHAANIQVNPYTVNDPEMMKMFKEMEVDSIITDYPDVCYEVRCSENAGTNEEGKIMDLRVQGIFGSIADYLGNDDNLKQ
ncbi:MAG: glycerophosphodiester phosphodiesterase family protein, partial [Bacillota bacterium]